MANENNLLADILQRPPAPPETATEATVLERELPEGEVGDLEEEGPKIPDKIAEFTPIQEIMDKYKLLFLTKDLEISEVLRQLVAELSAVINVKEAPGIGEAEEVSPETYPQRVVESIPKARL